MPKLLLQVAAFNSKKDSKLTHQQLRSKQTFNQNIVLIPTIVASQTILILEFVRILELLREGFELQICLPLLHFPELLELLLPLELS